MKNNQILIKHSFEIIILSFFLFGITNHNFSQSAQLTIGVLDFNDNSPFASSELKSMQQGLADMIITTLSQVNLLKIVERRQLNALLEEMALGQSGVINETTAQKVGRLLGTHYLVLGSFMKGFKNDIRIDCRIVKTETGETIKADEVSGNLKDILKLMNKLGEKVIRNLDIKLNSQEKTAIERLKTECPYEVVLEYFKALDLIEHKKYHEADKLLAKVIEQCPDFKRAEYTRKKMRSSLKKTKGNE